MKRALVITIIAVSLGVFWWNVTDPVAWYSLGAVAFIISVLILSLRWYDSRRNRASKNDSRVTGQKFVNDKAYKSRSQLPRYEKRVREHMRGLR
jgi:hypothetical protein